MGISTRALRIGARIAVAVGAVAATGCAGSVNTTPVATPTPGAVALSTSSLAFTATGAANAASVNATQLNYSGAFTASTSTCGGIATISPASGATFSITPVAAGSCTFTIAGGAGQSATLTIGVTTTAFGGS